jgi:hypothetical protein
VSRIDGCGTELSNTDAGIGKKQYNFIQIWMTSDRTSHILPTASDKTGRSFLFFAYFCQLRSARMQFTLIADIELIFPRAFGLLAVMVNGHDD